jgi:hypothetical protein
MRTPRLLKDGVKFIVVVEFVEHECLVTREALSKLANLQSGEADAMEIFRAYEAQICGVARRHIAANVPGRPLRLGPHSFH